MRFECFVGLPHWIDDLDPFFNEHFVELGIHCRYPSEQPFFAVFVGVVDASLEIVEHRDDVFDELFRCASGFFLALLFHATAVSVPFRMKSEVFALPFSCFFFCFRNSSFGRCFFGSFIPRRFGGISLFDDFSVDNFSFRLGISGSGIFYLFL